MNERLMQFRIGMFVIVAGLVLTMMIVWFGESPAILRDQVYVKVRYAEAPGVLEGVPVRKSGIRIGEVFDIAFDERKNEPDGVLVTLAIERKYKLHEGTIPRLGRSLIGDVTIDMQPGTSSGVSPNRKITGRGPDHRRRGLRLTRPRRSRPQPRPSIAPATRSNRSTLAAAGIAKISESAAKLDDFLSSVADAGKSVSKAADGINDLVKANESNLQPRSLTFAQVAAKLNKTFDPDTQACAQDGARPFLFGVGPARRRACSARPGPQRPGGARSTIPPRPTSARPSGESMSWPPTSSS